MASKDLREEVQKYSIIYGQVLVGIHNDLIDYKNKVNKYSKNSNEILSKCKSLLNDSAELKTSILETYGQIENLKNDIKVSVISNHEYLNDYEINLDKKLNTLNKYNEDFKQGLELVNRLSAETINLTASLKLLDERLDKEYNSLNDNVNSLRESMKNEILNLKELIVSKEISLKKENLELKESIQTLEEKVEEIQESLIAKENQIRNLEMYRIIFTVSITIIFILMFITNFL